MAAPLTTSQEMQTLVLHGDDLKYLDVGSGPTVVLIHGLLGSHHNWAPQIESLSRSYRVIVPDLFGHGDSDKPGGDYSISAHAASIRDLLKSLGIGSATFVGHSLGGGIAMQTLYLFPELVERMVLIASGGLGPEVSPLLRAASLPGSEFVLPMMASKTVRGITDLALDQLSKVGISPMSPSAEEAWRSFESVQDPGTRRAFLACVRSVIGFRGQTISATPHFASFPELDAMLVWGERDTIIPNSHTENARAELPRGRVEIFPRGGHFPHLDYPDRFDRVFDEFMDECGAAPHQVKPRLIAESGA